MTFNEQAVIDYVTKQRWYGAKSRSVAHSQVLDSVELRTTDPQFTLELVEMRYETGAHDIYQLLHGDTEIDGLEHPAAARELVHAMRAGLTLQGAEGTVEFRPVEGFAGLGRELLEARPVGGEQSNTSLVFDDELILKVFRRLEPGINPELEMLRFLTEHGFANIAALGGWYAYSGGPLSATLGILQEFVRGGVDGWELALDEIGSAPERFLARLRRLGEVTGEMHTALASDPNDPAFGPETPSVESLGLLTATVDEEIERVFLRCRTTTSGSRRSSGRGEEVREQLRMLTHAGSTGKIIRTHGDYHLGQTLWSEGRLGDPRLRGRARAAARRAAPQALAAARRRRDAPLVRLRRERGRAPERHARAGGLGVGGADAVPRRLPRDGRPDAPAAGPGGDRAAARGLRAREGGLRAPLRARQPPRSGLQRLIAVAGIQRSHRTRTAATAL